MNKKLLILNAALVAAFLTSCGGGTPSSAPSLHTSAEPSAQPSSEPSSESEAPLTLSDISAVKQLEAGTKAMIQATLLAKNDSGMFVQDESGSIFVYCGTSIDFSSFKLGSVLKITGYASIYAMSHQLSSYKVDDTTTLPVEVEVVTEGSDTVEINYTSMTIAELDDEDNEDVSLFGKPVVLRGTLQYNGTYNSPNCIVDGNGTKVALSRHPVGDIDIDASRGKPVEIKGFIYCYESGSFSLVTNVLRELEAEDLDDEEAVASAIFYLNSSFGGLSVTKDIELPTSYLGCTIAWVSDHPEVIENNGTYHTPSESPFSVNFAVTVARGEKSSEINIDMKALAPTEAKVVISESFTAGGNKGASYNCDFIELYNQSDVAVDLTGWSIQNASKSATSAFAVHELSGTIKPHDYFLIRGRVNTEDESFPVISEYDCSLANFNPAAGDYTLALCSSMTQITRTTDGKTATAGDIVDLLGVGGSLIFEGEKVSISGNVNSLQRKDPTIDTDNNKNDFIAATPTPTKSSSAE